jgi:hypothetical protein
VISITPEPTPELPPTQARETVSINNQTAEPRTDALSEERKPPRSNGEAPQASSRELLEAFDHYHVYREVEE